MPRSPRLHFPGGRHHVMSRTANGLEVFASDVDCDLFLCTLEQLPGLFGIRIHAWALMPNHYHLLLEDPLGNLSRAMQHLGLVFTQAYNRRRGREGALFRGRFLNRLVLDDPYWRYLLAYVHLNPVRAGIAMAPDRCLWTSHMAYIGESTRFPWHTTEDMLGFFGSAEALHEYVMDVHRKRIHAPPGFDADALWKAPDTASLSLPQPLPDRSLEQALEDVGRLFGVSPERVLVGSRAPRANLPRWMAAWWLRRGTASTQAQVAECMGVSRGRVRQLQLRLYQAARDDVDVRSVMAELEALVEADPA